MTETIACKAIGRCRKPGFLLAPLGWVQARLANLIEGEPRLIDLLFDLDHARMHLMALALAHVDNDIPPDLALNLLQGSSKTILNLSLGHHHPVGLARALHHLPQTVLSAEAYRQLVDLLTDRATAKFLHHRKSIDEKIIAGLATLPRDLRRPAILAMFDRVGGMAQFVEGLRCLAARAKLPFTALTTEIGSLNQTDQVVAKKIRTADRELAVIGHVTASQSRAVSAARSDCRDPAACQRLENLSCRLSARHHQCDLRRLSNEPARSASRLFRLSPMAARLVFATGEGPREY